MPASAGRTTAAGATVMSIGGQSQVPHTYWHLLARRDVLAGLLFVGVALLGLWLSRDYPVGTALRMGTGYMPRLLCWVLLGLGVVVLAQGLRQQAAPVRSSPQAWRAVIAVTLSLVAFGLSIERLGLVVAILLLTGIGAL